MINTIWLGLKIIRRLYAFLGEHSAFFIYHGYTDVNDNQSYHLLSLAILSTLSSAIKTHSIFTKTFLFQPYLQRSPLKSVARERAIRIPSACIEAHTRR